MSMQSYNKVYICKEVIFSLQDAKFYVKDKEIT